MLRSYSVGDRWLKYEYGAWMWPWYRGKTKQSGQKPVHHKSYTKWRSFKPRRPLWEADDYRYKPVQTASRFLPLSDYSINLKIDSFQSTDFLLTFSVAELHLRAEKCHFRLVYN